MPQRIKKYTIHIGIATAIAVLIAVLAFGRDVGGYEAQVRSNTKAIDEYAVEIKKVPVLEQALKDVREDVTHIKNSTDDIKNFLINKK